jgi:flagellar motor switch/type III secretory pathway protein FliN
MELENKDNLDIDDILSNISQSNDTILNTANKDSEITAYKQDYIAMLKDIQLNVSVVLGTVSVPLKRVLELKAKSILELDRNSDDDVDLY